MSLADLAVQVQDLPTDEYALALGLASVSAIAGAVLAWWMLKRARLIEDTPTSKIRSAAQGHVELEGIAQLLPGDPIIAPLSKQHCVWWKYSIEHKTTTTVNGKSRTVWTTVDSGDSDDLFQLADDTDDCVVDPEGATVIPNTKLSWYGHNRFPSKAPLKSQWIGFGRYRYNEQRVDIGTQLYALGWFRTEGGLAHTFDENQEVRDLLAGWKQDQTELLAEFDTNKDGQIDMDEWTAVRKKAIADVRAQHLQTASDPDIHVLCKPPRRLQFLLSTLPQAKLIRRSRLSSTAGLALFLAGGSAAIWLATVRGLI